MAIRIGAFITPGASLAAAVEHVKRAEDLGYEAVFATQIAQRDGLMTLAAYACATERIRLGTGVIPAFPRHPVALAYEAATLDEMSGGRLILGIGTSHRVTMESWYGLDMSRPLTQLKEYVTVLRDIFTTGRTERRGQFYTVSFGFMKYAARADLPIYLSALSPNTLRFAGAAADGVILWACMPSYIAEVVAPAVREGEKEAGRAEGACEIVAAVPAGVTDDPATARDRFRKEFFVYMTLPFYRRVIEGAGYDEDVATFDERLAAGDAAGARAAMSDPMLDELTGIGDAATVRAKVDEYRAAGVTLPAIAPAGGADVAATLEAAIS